VPLELSIVTIAEPSPVRPPPVGPPPGIIIVRRIRVVGVISRIIILFPKVDLFAREKGISVIHLSERPRLLSQDFPGDSNLPSLSKKIGVQDLFREGEEPSSGGFV
jgi:hypothetical protein